MTRLYLCPSKSPSPLWVRFYIAHDAMHSCMHNLLGSPNAKNMLQGNQIRWEYDRYLPIALQNAIHCLFYIITSCPCHMYQICNFSTEYTVYSDGWYQRGHECNYCRLSCRSCTVLLDFNRIIRGLWYVWPSDPTPDPKFNSEFISPAGWLL